MQLFCSFCATFTLNIFLSLSEGDKFGFLKLGSPGLVDFGTFGLVCILKATLNHSIVFFFLFVFFVTFGSSQDENKLWNAYHLIIFMLMGAVGGLLGALFNSLNVNLTKYRMKYLQRRSCRGFFRYMHVHNSSGLA